MPTPRPKLSPEAGRRAYLEAAVASRLAPTIREGQQAARTATRIAEKFGINETDAEAEVLALTYRHFSTEELNRYAKDPAIRKYARAELARRGL